MAVMSESYQLTILRGGLAGNPYALTLLRSSVWVDSGISFQKSGQIFGPVAFLSCSSQASKKSLKAGCTEAAVMIGLFVPSLARGDGLMVRKTLSPVVFGFV